MQASSANITQHHAAPGLYLERREELEHPLGVVAPREPPPPPSEAPRPLQAEAADFVLEIGCEELPPDDVTSALEQLRCGAAAHRSPSAL